MRIHNWPIKALIIVAAAAALWLALACQNPYPITIAPFTQCGPEIPMTSSIEYFTLEGAKVPEGMEGSLWAAQNPRSLLVEDKEMFIRGVIAAARHERLRQETERIQAILDKYAPLITNQEEVYDTPIYGRGVVSLYNKDGELTDKQVISIPVGVDYDQSKIPPAGRIPECMEGVEVHFKFERAPTDYLPDWAR